MLPFLRARRFLRFLLGRAFVLFLHIGFQLFFLAEVMQWRLPVCFWLQTQGRQAVFLGCIPLPLPISFLGCAFAPAFVSRRTCARKGALPRRRCFSHLKVSPARYLQSPLCARFCAGRTGRNPIVCILMP